MEIENLDPEFDIVKAYDDIQVLRHRHPQEIIRLLHLGTVENFIFHFNFIKDRYSKRHIYKNLQEYLALISEGDLQLEKATSRELFATYLEPIISHYEIRQGFTLYPPINIQMFWFVCLSILLLIIQASLTMFIGLSVLFFLYNLYLERKKRLKKIYGLYF